MLYVGLGTTEEMINNLAHSYEIRGMRADQARERARLEVYEIEHNTQKAEIIHLAPLKYRKIRNAQRTLASKGNILWKEQDGERGRERVYFPVGSLLYVTDDRYIRYCANSRQEIFDAVAEYNARINAWNAREVPA